MRAILAATLMLATNCVSAGTVYHVDLVNNATSSIVSLEVARAGSTRFRALRLDTSLPGGGASATVAIRKGDDGCLRDLRVGLADGRVLTHRRLDVCR
jgi:hypothetical protein